MHLYAVALVNPGETTIIEFFWADDYDHACEQALDANHQARIDYVAVVPTQDGGFLRWKDGVNDVDETVSPDARLP